MSTNDPKRVPIPVGAIWFPYNAAMNLPGKSTCTSITHRDHAVGGKESKHTLEYLPWIRTFRVTFEERETKESRNIPEARVESWCELVLAEPAEPAKPKKTTRTAAKSTAAPAEQ